MNKPMRVPKQFDAIDLLYAADCLCNQLPISRQGFTRKQAKVISDATDWWLDGIRKAVISRKKRLKR